MIKVDVEDSNLLKEMSDKFFKLAKNDNTKKVLQEILYEGRYGDYIFSTGITNKDNEVIEVERRIAMANLFITNPSSFYILTNTKSNLFHGTKANALFSILKYGINSLSESTKKGIEVTTGEKWSRVDGHERKFISFTDNFDVAQNYSSKKTSDEENNMNFEMIIGISSDDIKDNYTSNIVSDVPEIGVLNNVSRDTIKVIFVPDEKVEFVRKVVGEGIIVMAIQRSNDKFYSLSDYGGIRISDLKYNNLDQSIINRPKIFGNEEIKETVLKRTISKIKNAINFLKRNNIEEKEEIYDTGKTR